MRPIEALDLASSACRPTIASVVPGHSTHFDVQRVAARLLERPK